jgi:GNAT superfamily N-acetyltransferase
MSSSVKKEVFLVIRQAKEAEAEQLTKISFKSKGHWGYPKEYFDIWIDELTISPAYIKKNAVFVVENHGVLIGYYSIVELNQDIEISGIKIQKGFWLEHMFVTPQHIGKGIGTRMFDHLREWCCIQGIFRLSILADPNSRGFYQKMGCEYVSEFPSTIKNRTTPYLILGTEKS